MEHNPVLNAAMYEIVDNQIREGTPPETRQTFDRLLSEGVSKAEARRLIACVVASEIFNMLKQGKPYDEARFAQALGRLPRMPWEE